MPASAELVRLVLYEAPLDRRAPSAMPWNVTLRTRDDARHYMAALPDQRARTTQWQIAARRLLDGDTVEAATYAIELALLYEARLDMKHSNQQRAAGQKKQPRDGR
jgi:hypothetical protein